MRKRELGVMRDSLLAVGGQRKEPLKAWSPLGISGRERGSRKNAELRRGLDLAFPSGTIIRDERNPIGIAPVLYAASVYQAIRRICVEVGKEPPPLVIANTSPAVGRILRDEFREPEVQASIFLSEAHGEPYSLLPVTESGYPGHLEKIVRNVNEVEDKTAALDAQSFSAISLTGEEKMFDPPKKVIALNTGAPFSTAAVREGNDIFTIADPHLYRLMLDRYGEIYRDFSALVERAIPIGEAKYNRIDLISRTVPHAVQMFPEMRQVWPYTHDIAYPLTPPVQEAMQPPIDTFVDRVNGVVFFKKDGKPQTASINDKTHVAYLNISFSSAFGLEQATTLVAQLNEMNIAVLCPPWLKIPGTIPTGPEVMYQEDESTGELKSVIDFQIARAGQGSTGRSLDRNVPLFTFPGHQELWKESPEILANEEVINMLGIGTPLVFTEQGYLDENLLQQNLSKLSEMRESIKTVSEMTRLFGGIPDTMSGADVIAQQIVIKEIARAKAKIRDDQGEKITLLSREEPIELTRDILRTDAYEIEFLSPTGFTVETDKTLSWYDLARTFSPNEDLSDKQQNWVRLLLESVDDREETWKYAARNPRQVGDRLIMDFGSQPWISYESIGNPTDPAELLALADPLGNATILITADNKIIVQKRKPWDEVTNTGDKFYGGIPGASVANLFPAKRVDVEDENSIGMPVPLGNAQIEADVRSRAQREIGVPSEHITSVTNHGLGSDRVRVHRELLNSARTDLTYEQIKNLPQSTENDVDGFAEEFFAINATSDAIKTLVTQMRIPIPPTHTAAFVATGYSLRVDENIAKGLSRARAILEANHWLRDVQQGVQENITIINDIVRMFWRSKPIEEMRDNIGYYNTTGFDPRRSGPGQGLSTIESEVDRLDLAA